MAVVLLRVDQRLLHGQVVEGWVPFLRADSIVVADDRSAADPLSRIAMTAACPAKVKLSLLTVAQAAAGPLPGARILVLVATVEAAARLWEAGFRTESVNLGNVPITAGRRRITPSVALSAEEVRALDRIAEAGSRVEVRAVPREKAADLILVHRVLESEGEPT